jgi:hypothetical protein
MMTAVTELCRYGFAAVELVEVSGVSPWVYSDALRYIAKPRTLLLSMDGSSTSVDTPNTTGSNTGDASSSTATPTTPLQIRTKDERLRWREVSAVTTITSSASILSCSALLALLR